MVSWTLDRNEIGLGTYKRYGGTWYTYRTNGHIMQAHYADQGAESDITHVDTSAVVAYIYADSATTTFDLAGYQEGDGVFTVVVTAFLILQNGESAAQSSINLYIYDPNGSSIKYKSVTLPARSNSSGVPQVYWGWLIQTIGINGGCTGDDAVHMNGTYMTRVKIGMFGSNNDTNLSVSNYPSPTCSTGDMGFMWVSGGNICFIDGTGAVIKMRQHGTISYVGTQYAGSIWIDDTAGDYRLYYVTENGYSAVTKLGSLNACTDDYSAGNNELPVSTSTSNAGYMWVKCSGNDETCHCIYVVMQDGKVARFSGGSIWNDMQ